MTPSPSPIRLHSAAHAIRDGVVASAGPSFEQVYDDYVEFVWRSIRRLGVDESATDDVLQQVFLVVHRRLSEFAGASSMRTWLFGILIRVVHDHRRTLRRKSPHLRNASASTEDELARVPDPSATSNPEAALSRAEASRVIGELLESLDDDKRAVFVMSELEQMTAVEVGQVLGVDPKVVYSRLRAARTDFERAAAAMRRRGLGRTP